MDTHTNPLKLTRAEIRRRICAMPVSRQQVRLMQKVIAELRREKRFSLTCYLFGRCHVWQI